jgi:hypothetical protein
MKRVSPDFEVIYIDNDDSNKAINMSFQNKKYLYGITKEQFMEIVEAQGFRCGSCGDDAKGYEHTLNVDHDHYTNEIRGIICSGCNSAAHWLDDSPEKAKKLADYLVNCGTGIYIS